MHYDITEQKSITHMNEKEKRMNKQIKRALCILGAAAVLSSCLAGCSNKNNGSSDPNAAQTVSSQELSQKLSFKVKDIPSPEGYSLEDKIALMNDVCYTVNNVKVSTADGTYTKSLSALAFDTNGKVVYETPVLTEDELKDKNYNVSINGMCVTDSGECTMLVTATAFDENWNATTITKLVTLGADGSVKNSLNTSDIIAESEKDRFYISSFVVDKEGYSYIALGEGIVRMLDPEGKVKGDIKVEDTSNSWVTSLFTNSEGKACVCVSAMRDNVYTTQIMSIDREQLKFNSPLSVTANIRSCYSGSGDYFCYCDSDTGVLGIKPDGSAEIILNLISLGVDTSMMSNFSVSSDGKFLVGTNDYSGGQMKVTSNLIYPVDPSEIPEKTVITLGCFALDWSVKQKLAQFNAENDKYTIYVNSYSDLNNTEIDYEGAVTKFNNELLTGNIPDMVFINENMPIDSYISKGLFTDLYALMDSDSELSRSDLQENILTASSRDGKLYYISPVFNITTCIAKRSLVGDKTTLSITEANQIVEGIGEGGALFQDVTRETFMTNSLAFSKFVDYSNASCDFDNAAFKAFLTEAAKYPEEIDWEKIYNTDPDHYSTVEMSYRNGKTLLSSANLYNYDFYNWAVKGRFGEPVAYVNYPCEEPVSNSVIDFPYSLAVSDASAVKDGSWAFIKFLINNTVTQEPYTYYTDDGKLVVLDEYKYVCDMGFPLKKSDRSKLEQQALIPSHYYDSKGEKHESDNIYYVGNQEIKLENMTQSDVDDINSLIENAKTVTKKNEQIMKIINDEAKSYFSGVKSVDDVAATVQSRVSIYMSEQY